MGYILLDATKVFVRSRLDTTRGDTCCQLTEGKYLSFIARIGGRGMAMSSQRERNATADAAHPELRFGRLN